MAGSSKADDPMLVRTPDMGSLRSALAGRFTIADIVIGYAAFLATTLGADDVLGEATKAWLARCTALYAWKLYRSILRRYQPRHK